MKRLKLTATLCGILLFLFSCSNEETTTCVYENTTNAKIEQARQNVIDFLKKVEPHTRGYEKPKVISDINPYIQTNPKTRGNSTSGIDTLFYVINFEDNNGFALATADTNGTGVLALVENGNFMDTMRDSIKTGFHLFMEQLIESRMHEESPSDIEDIKRGPDTDITDSDKHWNDIIGDDNCGTIIPEDKFIIQKPLLVTNWGQEDPFNLYCPGDYTGCVITAVSQICSFLETPNIISYNNIQCHLDWQRIKEESKGKKGNYKYFTDETESQIAHLMRFWGIAFEAKYEKESTSANSNNALNKLRNNYAFNVSKLKDYNIDNVINDLKTGNKIIYMRGYTHYRHILLVLKDYYGGHAWVVDGYIYNRKNGIESKYIHCNWGWNGWYNGYYAYDNLHYADGLKYDDNGIECTNTFGEDVFNYKYKLETATFTK